MENVKRRKPFVSKQTRHEKGKKQKPGLPTLQRHVSGPEQFYFFGQNFTCKKEIRDRVRQLLISCITFNMRPETPGALNPSLKKSVDDHLLLSLKKGEKQKIDIINNNTNPILFQHFQEIAQHHPNFSKWSNKNISYFRVTTNEDLRKTPPMLFAHFKGNELKPRLVKWMKCLSKSFPSPTEKMTNALHFSSSQKQEELASTNFQKSCQRCSLNRPYIDHVKPSYPFHGPLFHTIQKSFLSTFPEETLDQITQRLQWVKKKNAFMFHPCDTGFLLAWLTYNKNYFQNTEWLCETCRIESWVTSLHFQDQQLKNKCRLD